MHDYMKYTALCKEHNCDLTMTYYASINGADDLFSIYVQSNENYFAVKRTISSTEFMMHDSIDLILYTIENAIKLIESPTERLSEMNS